MPWKFGMYNITIIYNFRASFSEACIFLLKEKVGNNNEVLLLEIGPASKFTGGIRRSGFKGTFTSDLGGCDTRLVWLAGMQSKPAYPS